MCGIIGYTGKDSCVPLLMEGLKTLEYRGYDSAGIAVHTPDGLVTVKSRGRLDALGKKLAEVSLSPATCGIGHTRWATHGAPSDVNSHPHSTPRLCLVHNGIIENYAELEERLRGAGYSFESDTDTERGAKLIDMLYARCGDPVATLHRAAECFRGSFALGVIFADFPDTVFAIRRDSPLIVAHTGESGIIASDIPAILSFARRHYRLNEGVVARLTPHDVRFYDAQGNQVEQRMSEVDWSVEQAQKGGFPHFMIKEIHEEPAALLKTVQPHIQQGLPVMGVNRLDGDSLRRVSAIHVVACGTAMHAGLVGKAMIERLARVPVNVEIASEFRYRDPILGKNDMVILLSQSGETADTLAALRHAKACGVYTLAIVNVMGSTVAREADDVLYTRAGPEIAVASTKAYSVQCALLYLLALQLGLARGTLDEGEARDACRQMTEHVPAAVRKTLELSPHVRDIAARLTATDHAFYIGRDLDSALCTEGSLKLKEISYIHSEAYAAGELKHGTISLITEGTPVIALATQPHVWDKTLSGIREVRSRGAFVILITTPALAEGADLPADRILLLPDDSLPASLFAAATALQLLAYHVSALRGLDVDKPRNLAKSVTVE